MNCNLNNGSCITDLNIDNNIKSKIFFLLFGSIQLYLVCIALHSSMPKVFEWRTYVKIITDYFHPKNNSENDSENDSNND